VASDSSFRYFFLQVEIDVPCGAIRDWNDRPDP
jgi:hypothetical protein